METKTNTTNELVANVRAAQRAGTPLVAISTSDIGATMRQLSEALGQQTPQLWWDCAAGMHALNLAGEEAQKAANKSPEDYQGNPGMMLDDAKLMPPMAVIYMANAHMFWDNPMVVQGIWNLRDVLKRDNRMLVMLGGDLHRLPSELATSVISFDEPLPGDEQLQKIARGCYDDAKEAMDGELTEEDIHWAACNLRGTGAFQAEQLVAMSLTKSGLNHASLRTHSRKLIEETQGLSVDRENIRFSDIGGLEQAKEFARRLFGGRKPPRVVVRLEELEKVMGGAKTDTSGTSPDALQMMLSAMEDNQWNGMLAYGAPGAGKSFFSKAMATEYDALGMQLDINACKGSLVGESEKHVRAAMKVIKTIGAKEVFFVASVNSLDSIPPELQRRFKCGTWFFDVPSPEERETVWAINRKRFEIPAEDETPQDSDLTGADIRNICEMAYSMNCTLREAMDFVVPLKVQSPQAIEETQKRADGRFLSASTKGVYRKPSQQRTETSKTSQGRRQVQLD